MHYHCWSIPMAVDCGVFDKPHIYFTNQYFYPPTLNDKCEPSPLVLDKPQIDNRSCRMCSFSNRVATGQLFIVHKHVWLAFSLNKLREQLRHLPQIFMAKHTQASTLFQYCLQEEERLPPKMCYDDDEDDGMLSTLAVLLFLTNYNNINFSSRYVMELQLYQISMLVSSVISLLCVYCNMRITIAIHCIIKNDTVSVMLLQKSAFCLCEHGLAICVLRILTDW